MNRNQPPNIIAAQQKVLEHTSRMVAQNSPDHMNLQALKLLGQQLKSANNKNGGPAAQLTAAQLKQLTSKHNLNQIRQAQSPYARPQADANRPKEKEITQRYEDLINVVEELGKDVRPTYAGSKSAAERLKRGLQHARQLVRESQQEAEKLVRSQN